MDVREKLVELLSPTSLNFEEAVYLADYLVKNGVTVQERISVDERLPEEKVNCIVYYKHAFCDDENHVGISVCFYDGYEFQMDSLHKVARWMPLPHLPKGE